MPSTGRYVLLLAYLREGGPRNLAQLARFLSGTVLLSGEEFEPPEVLQAYGRHGSATPAPGQAIGIVFYRSHAVAGNTAFADTLADAVEACGASAVPVFCGTLRAARKSSTTCSAGWRGRSSRCSRRAARWRRTRPRAATMTPGTWPRWPPWTCR